MIREEKKTFQHKCARLEVYGTFVDGMGSIDHVLWDGGGLCHNMKILTNNLHQYQRMWKKTAAQSTKVQHYTVGVVVL